MQHKKLSTPHPLKLAFFNLFFLDGSLSGTPRVFLYRFFIDAHYIQPRLFPSNYFCQRSKNFLKGIKTSSCLDTCFFSLSLALLASDVFFLVFFVKLMIEHLNKVCLPSSSSSFFFFLRNCFP